jgi:hypothetical protein
MEVIRERPWSTVWRDGDRWVKRCPPHEVALTTALAARWPDVVVEVLEADGDTLVLADAGAADPDPWLEVLPRYAELQRGEVAHAGAHLAAGVPDQRVETLLDRFDEFPRFAHFRRRFVELLGRLTLPPTVQHDDLHAGNVFGGRIIDWGDAVIGHPFTTLLVTLRVYDGDPRPLRDAYLEVWGREHEAELDAALQIGAFTRILSWQRIDPASPSLEANVEWFLEHVASS